MISYQWNIHWTIQSSFVFIIMLWFTSPQHLTLWHWRRSIQSCRKFDWLAFCCRSEACSTYRSPTERYCWCNCYDHSHSVSRCKSSCQPWVHVLILSVQVCGYVMSDDADVVKLVSIVMPLVASFQISDGLAGSCGGSLRGQGTFHLSCFADRKWMRAVDMF